MMQETIFSCTEHIFHEDASSSLIYVNGFRSSWRTHLTSWMFSSPCFTKKALFVCENLISVESKEDKQIWLKRGQRSIEECLEIPSIHSHDNDEFISLFSNSRDLLSFFRSSFAFLVCVVQLCSWSHLDAISMQFYSKRRQEEAKSLNQNYEELLRQVSFFVGFRIQFGIMSISSSWSLVIPK